MHLPPIVQDLSIILMAAAAMTLLFRALRQPVVLGYIIAGFLIGPHFRWLPGVVDSENVKVWAEIGVIFLLFSLGLEFSFKKLARVGAPASITALIEVIGMIGIGFAIGHLFGWKTMDSLFLGGILAISSTTIIVRAFDELGMKTRGFANLVFGVLVVEDLFAILLMVVLSTVAVSHQFSGVEIGIAAMKLLFFLTLWFVLGIFLIPSVLKRTRRLLSEETLLVVSVGLCFMMVVFVTKVGFSPALGAFIMGSILAETMEAERIEHLIRPAKNLFGAVFFVSVGMLIDPGILSKYAVPILVITIATILGKLVTTTVGALVSGQSLRHSIQAGMSLAQIGEFSFIIAALGLSLKVTEDFLFPIAISVSAITTFTTPYMIRSADGLVKAIENFLPTHWLAGLERYRLASISVAQTNEWRDFVRKSIIKIFTNGVVVTAIFLLVAEYFDPWLQSQLSRPETAHAISLLTAFLMSSPFLWALTFGRVRDKASALLWSEGRYKLPLFAFQLSRWMISLFLCAFLSSRIVFAEDVIVVVSLVVVLGIFLLSRYFKNVYFWLEKRFIFNLHEKEVAEQAQKLPTLAPWDAHLAQLDISSNSRLVGKKFSELMIRERFGVTVALVQRGHQTIAAPGGDEFLYPADVLQVIGSDEQISRFKQECEGTEAAIESDSKMDYGLRSRLVRTTDSFVNKTIRDCGLREATQGLVVGIEKKGFRTLNPDSMTLIEAGDVLWVVGNRELIAQI
jgi:CPA2 family monovalent cation:H+ antiporter-2